MKRIWINRVVDFIFMSSDIGKMHFAAQENTVMQKTYAKFLVKLSELLPKETLKNISLLIEHLDSEVYQIFCHSHALFTTTFSNSPIRFDVP